MSLKLRGLGSLLLVFAAIGVYGQEPTDPNEQLIYEALSNLQGASPFELTMTGTETIGSQTRTFQADLFWSCGTTAQLEMDDWDTSGQNPVMTRRYVGDGHVLWFYDLTTYRYSGATYGTYGSTPTNPLVDSPRLLSQLYTEANGSDSYLVRLMREINPPVGGTLIPRYETWAPGYTPGQPPTTPAVQDPLVAGQSYSDLGNQIYVLYGPNPILFNPPGPPENGTPTRSVAFQLINTMGSGSIPNYNLESIFFADESPGRLTSWTMQVMNPAVISDPNTFKPYPAKSLSGWAVVPAPRPTG